MTTTGTPNTVWRPPAEALDASNLARLMRSMGHDPRDYAGFHKRTVADPAGYLEAALDDLAFPWHEAPERLLEGWTPGGPIHDARWYRGASVNVFDVAVTHQLAEGRADQPALVWENEQGATRTLTFGQLQLEVDAVARALAASGVRRGQVVAVMVPTVPEAVALYYALLKIGAVFSPIATDMSAEQVAVRLGQADVRFMVGADGFTTRGQAKSLKPTIDEAARIHGRLERLVVVRYAEITGVPMTADRDVWWTDWLRSGEGHEAPETVQAGPDDLTMLLFSSGTTGTPKGTRHGFAAWIEDMLENAYGADLRPGDRSFWLTNVGWMMFPWLLAGHGLGATVVLYEGAHDHPKPDRLLRLIGTHRLTHVGLSPDPLRLVIDTVEADPRGVAAYDLASLRELRNTGAPLTTALFDRTLRVLGKAVSGAWGGTDGCFCLGGGNPCFPREGASMTPWLGMDVHVMRYDAEARTFRDCGDDEVGEVVVQAPFPSMTKGLLNDDDGQRFRASYFAPKLAVPADTIETEGLRRWWFHGDLGRMRGDGALWILGRADDLLVVRGTNIDPTSVSDAIADLVRASAPVVCIDGDSSELFVFVVRRPGDASAPDELERAVQKRVRDRVNKRTPPKRVFAVSGIPSTINNKPQLRLVRNAFLGEPLGDTSTLRNAETLDEIATLGKAYFGR